MNSNNVINITKEIFKGYFSYNTILYVNQLGYMINKSKDGKYNSKIDKSFKKDFNDLFTCANKLKTTFVPYSLIYNKIFTLYHNEKIIYGMDGLCMKLKDILRNRLDAEKDDSYVSCGYIVLAKTIEYINLTSIQINTLYNEQKQRLDNLNNNSKQISKDLSRNCKRMKELSKHLATLKKNEGTLGSNVRDVYGKFIAILGIFATIIVAMFGGLSAISNSIEALAKYNNSIFNIILMSLLFSAVLLFMIFFLFVCISKLLGNPINKIDANGNPQGFFRSCPIFISGIAILFILFIFTLIFRAEFIFV